MAAGSRRCSLRCNSSRARRLVHSRAYIPRVIPGLKERLRALESDELLTRARQLEELRSSNAWEFMTELWSQGREQLVNRMVRVPMSEREYAHLGGTITGMDIAGEIIETVLAEAREHERKINAGEFRQEEE